MMNLDFDQDKYTISYNMYTRFAKFFSGYDYLETYLSIRLQIKDPLWSLIVRNKTSPSKAPPWMYD